MVHLYLCLPDRCGQQIHKSKGDRQCKIGQKENVCLFCCYVFSVRTGQADRGINAPSDFIKRISKYSCYGYNSLKKTSVPTIAPPFVDSKHYNSFPFSPI